MPRTRLTAIFYLILVFASGILVGVVSTRLYAVKASVKAVPSVPRNMAELTSRYVDEMRQKVGVNDEQADAVKKILADTKRKFDDLRREERPLRDRIQQEQVDAIRAILTDAQRPAYEAWRAERQKEQQSMKQSRGKSAASASGDSSAR
jgi:uncharacterized protein YdiU (UPF0061 family)